MANLILWNSRNVEYAPVRPAGPHILASWLRQFGYSIKVIDYCNIMSMHDLISITEKNIDSKTLAVGVSSTFWELGGSEEPFWVSSARQKIQHAYPKLYWLIGGPGSYTTLKMQWVKFNGYAEDSLLKWMDSNSFNLKIRPQFDIKNAHAAFNEDDYILPQEVLPLEMGRGCQFKCSFCSYPLIGKKKGTYIKNANNVREELIYNYHEYGVTKYICLDDTVNESEEKILELAKVAQSLPFEISWAGFNRLDLIWSRPSTKHALIDSGLKASFFGIESFQPQASLAIGKGWNGKKGKDFLLELKQLWSGKITWTLGFIVGLPGDTPDNIEDTFRWCEENEMPSWVFQFLYLGADTDKIDKSEFEINAAQYGYDLQMRDGQSFWSNEHWTLDAAKIAAAELKERSYKIIKPPAMHIAELSNLGQSFGELAGTRIRDLNYEKFTINTLAHVHRYVQKQLNQ